MGFIKGILFSVLVALVVMMFIPTDDDPIADWESIVPQEFPANNILQSAEYLIPRGELTGAEDFEFDNQGNIYTGTVDGRIWKISSDGKQKEVIARTTGRPLALRFDKTQTNLIFADADIGLLSLHMPTRTITILATESDDGILFKFTDYLTIAKDGTIYFTDASYKYGVHNFPPDVINGRPRGRVLKYDPTSKKVTTIATGLYFANGIELGKNEEFLYVCETWKSRIVKIHLSGPKKGEKEIFANNLPGLPDNIVSNGKGTLWVGLPTPSKGFVGYLAAPYPPLKRLLLRLSAVYKLKPEKVGMVVGIDESTGKITHYLMDSTGAKVDTVTTAREKDGYLYLGTYLRDFVAKVKVPSN